MDAACAVATAPSTLGKDRLESMEMGVLPAEAWSTGFLAKLNDMRGSCKIRHLLPGQYSIIVQVDEKEEMVRGADSRFPPLEPAIFRYCFLCPKTKILLDWKATQGQDEDGTGVSEAPTVVIDPGTVDVMDAATFLGRTAPWLGPVELDAHIQHL